MATCNAAQYSQDMPLDNTFALLVTMDACFFYEQDQCMQIRHSFEHMSDLRIVCRSKSYLSGEISGADSRKRRQFCYLARLVAWLSWRRWQVWAWWRGAAGIMLWADVKAVWQWTYILTRTAKLLSLWWQRAHRKTCWLREAVAGRACKD